MDVHNQPSESIMQTFNAVIYMSRNCNVIDIPRLNSKSAILSTTIIFWTNIQCNYLQNSPKLRSLSGITFFSTKDSKDIIRPTDGTQASNKIIWILWANLAYWPLILHYISYDKKLWPKWKKQHLCWDSGNEKETAFITASSKSDIKYKRFKFTFNSFNFSKKFSMYLLICLVAIHTLKVMIPFL